MHYDIRIRDGLVIEEQRASRVLVISMPQEDIGASARTDRAAT